jgi:hypothetical protein
VKWRFLKRHFCPYWNHRRTSSSRLGFEMALGLRWICLIELDCIIQNVPFLGPEMNRMPGERCGVSPPSAIHSSNGWQYYVGPFCRKGLSPQGEPCLHVAYHRRVTRSVASDHPAACRVFCSPNDAVVFVGQCGLFSTTIGSRCSLPWSAINGEKSEK